MRPFRRRGTQYVASLDRDEAAVLAVLLDQLEQLLTVDDEPAPGPGPGTDAGPDAGSRTVLARLLPDGHRGDAALAADYRELTRADLLADKVDDLATVRATLPADGGTLRLDAVQAACWLRASNDLRLALGTRLGIGPDSEPPEEVRTEADQQLVVYYWLTAVQGSLVDALAAGRGGRT